MFYVEGCKDEVRYGEVFLKTNMYYNFEDFVYLVFCMILKIRLIYFIFFFSIF